MLSHLAGWFGGDAGRRWFTRVLLPVLAYAFLVGAALEFGHDLRLDLLDARLEAWLSALQEQAPLTSIALLAVGLLAAAVVLEALDLPLTRYLEGYWPALPVVGWSRQWHSFSHWCDRRLMLARLARLEDDRCAGRLDAAGFAEREWLDLALERYPEREELFLPTRFGNALRAAEQKVGARYGLNGVVLWPRLWLVLPEPVKAELIGARSRIALLVRIWWLAALLVPWAWRAWWLAPVGVLVSTLIHRRLLDAAGLYGELFVAAYEVHRFALYRALRWPLPRSTVAEKALGEALTRHVWRGADPHLAVAFRDAEK